MEVPMVGSRRNSNNTGNNKDPTFASLFSSQLMVNYEYGTKLLWRDINLAANKVPPAKS